MYGSARGRQILQYKINPNPNPNPNTNPSSPYCIMRFIFGSRVHVPSRLSFFPSPRALPAMAGSTYFPPEYCRRQSPGSLKQVRLALDKTLKPSGVTKELWRASVISGSKDKAVVVVPTTSMLPFGRTGSRGPPLKRSLHTSRMQ